MKWNCDADVLGDFQGKQKNLLTLQDSCRTLLNTSWGKKLIRYLMQKESQQTRRNIYYAVMRLSAGHCKSQVNLSSVQEGGKKISQLDKTSVWECLAFQLIIKQC